MKEEKEEGMIKMSTATSHFNNIIETATTGTRHLSLARRSGFKKELKETKAALEAIKGNDQFYKQAKEEMAVAVEEDLSQIDVDTLKISFVILSEEYGKLSSLLTQQGDGKDLDDNGDQEESTAAAVWESLSLVAVQVEHVSNAMRSLWTNGLEAVYYIVVTIWYIWANILLERLTEFLDAIPFFPILPLWTIPLYIVVYLLYIIVIIIPCDESLPVGDILDAKCEEEEEEATRHDMFDTLVDSMMSTAISF